jgi:predicted nucleic acid-binding protein
MSDKAFVDTNIILVYAHDLDAGEKNTVARKLLTELWESRLGIVSTQVLQEFYVMLTKKIQRPLDVPTVRRLVRNYSAWEVVVNGVQNIVQASEIQEAHRLSFWDALIDSAAFAGNAATILTEDLSHGQQIEGILIQNPFVTETSA